MFKYFGYVGFVLFALTLGGCGGDEVAAPGEEVVVSEWVDPTDIGGEYVVGEVKTGDTVTLSTGETYTIGPLFSAKENDDLLYAGAMLDIINSEGDGRSLLTSATYKKNPDRPGDLLTDTYLERGYIVPEGPPIVFLSIDERVPGGLGELETVQVTGENNSQEDSVWLSFSIEIDRILDYNLPIYIEFQSQDRGELGGGVQRVRFLTVVLKGDTRARTVYVDDISYGFGDSSKHVRTSVSILPYTEMERIALPAHLDIDHRNVSLEDQVLLEGHVFRPYRIASSSYLMGEAEIERNW